jgi:hypothetical protein
MKTLITLGILLTFSSFVGKDRLKGLGFLAGTWKTENKENYESWKVINDSLLEGNGYKMKRGQKVVTEYFSIKAQSGKIVYQATVPDQNNGKTIDFELNKSLKNKYSFENLSHDFPKKVQYTKLNDTTIFVEVLGEHDKGFSYKMMKRK